jgi:tryptophan synthase alpha chain
MTSGIDRLRAVLGPESSLGGRAKIVAYVPAGDPEAGGGDILDVYADAGVDVLEIGIPSPDPWLDGPEIADSMRRSLEAGFEPTAFARRLADWRARCRAPAPAVVWFSYPGLPPATIEAAARMGALDGLLMLRDGRGADGAPGTALSAALGIARCAFLPWDDTEDHAGPARLADGYLMVQARPGPTGEDRDAPAAPAAGGAPAAPAGAGALGRRIALARRLAPGVPVVAGFGIHDAPSAARVSQAGVDGIVVGSACVRAFREGGAKALARLLRELGDTLVRSSTGGTA